MGGFEIMNELLEMVNVPEFEKTWLDYASQVGTHYEGVVRKRYVKRLMAYAAAKRGDKEMADQVWRALWGEVTPSDSSYAQVCEILPPEVPQPVEEWPGISTNQAALWSLDAIYLQEVLK